MDDFRQALNKGRVIVSDGGMGTLLQQKGMPSGASPELFTLEHPEILKGIHAEYVQAGSMIITTNTFGGARHKLGPGVDVVSVNARLTALAREAAGGKAWVAGGIGPTGLFVEPLGKISFSEMVEAFREQIRGLAAGGADLILGETMFDLAEARAVAIAARLETDLPVGVSMTFEDGKSLTGTNPLTFVDTMQNLGADLVSVNCSAGPVQFLDVVEAMLPRLEIPLLVYPNAGLPVLEDGKTVFKLGPEDFAAQTVKLVEKGAQLAGGCCGTTPAHIKALAEAVNKVSFSRPSPKEGYGLVLTSRSESAVISPSRPCLVIGERINPTGKKDLTAQLQQGKFDRAVELAEEQVRDSAGLLDVNVGAAMVDEVQTLSGLVKVLGSRVNIPLCLDSTDPKAIEAALNCYPGSPLVNSISGEPGRMDQLGPLCRLYGAPFILLPLVGKKLPVSSKERIEIIESLVDQALAMGVRKRQILVDVLALTVSSKAEAARHCLETIRYCSQELGLPTVCGLSNISFGLPARELLNSTFLAMAVSSGLSACIANPGSPRLREILAASEVLMNRDPQAESFIRSYTGWTPGEGGSGAGQGRAGGDKEKKGSSDAGVAVIKGDLDRIVELVEAELAKGIEPFDLVESKLIPAITEVGDKYERKEYFLPQLIRSAETMQKAFEHLKPLLKKREGEKERPVAIMATVEGDIHDIGKNIVILMLGNHGFDVVDLGKDVPAEAVIKAAKEKNARIIGLSALMTTTMVRMEETVRLVRENGLQSKVMIGGAVVTREYADKIGADGYAPDAVGAVKVAKSLL